MGKRRDSETGRFLAADPPKATRARLGQAILRDVITTWDARGAAALVTLAEEDPTAFVKLAAGLLPKETESRGGDAGEAFVRIWRAISEGALPQSAGSADPTAAAEARDTAGPLPESTFR